MGVGITVEHLNAFYGKTQALFDINITVLANHATALIGPSGCGKSTFIRCLTRRVAYTAPTVERIFATAFQSNTRMPCVWRASAHD